MKLNQVKIGDLIEVEWWDITRPTNRPIEQAKPAHAFNIGFYEKKNDKFVWLRSGWYVDDGESPDMDTTVIPKGTIENINMIKKRRKK